MDLKSVVSELVKEFEEIKKLEKEVMIKVGQFDQKTKALMKELGFAENEQFNVAQVLKAAFDKQSPLILP